MARITETTSNKLNKIAKSHTYLFCFLVEEHLTEEQAQTIIHKTDLWVKTLKEIQ
jgi:hypothetical protein